MKYCISRIEPVPARVLEYKSPLLYGTSLHRTTNIKLHSVRTLKSYPPRLDLDIGFDRATYPGMEGGMAQLVVTLSTPADRDITVVLNTNPDSADGKRNTSLIL